MIQHRSDVSSSPDGKAWDIDCSCGWASTRWPNRGAASTRMQQHRTEHATSVPMPELGRVSL
jgi:hypothetical protein